MPDGKKRFAKDSLGIRFVLLMLLLSWGRAERAFADIDLELKSPVETHVVEVIQPEKDGDTLLVLLSAFGRALRLDPNTVTAADRSVIEAVSGTERRIRLDFVDLGETDILLNVEEIEPGPVPEIMFLDSRTADEEDVFTPEPLTTFNDAANLFAFLQSKYLRRNSECFHRAYLWAYDMWNERKYFSEKVFLFFTRRYMREYNYRWWFHVSPYINTDQGELVLDATYTRGPLDMRTWTNIFMQNDAYCPVVAAYYGWQAHYVDRYCYLRKVNMYYYHPNRVMAADRNGYIIRQWDWAGLRNSQVARP